MVLFYPLYNYQISPIYSPLRPTYYICMFNYIKFFILLKLDNDADTFDWSIETYPDIGSSAVKDESNGTK